LPSIISGSLSISTLRTKSVLLALGVGSGYRGYGFYLFAYIQLATSAKVPLMLPPRVDIAAIAATATNAAISAYSIAVTPNSSLIRLVKRVRKRFLLGFATAIAC